MNIWRNTSAPRWEINGRQIWIADPSEPVEVPLLGRYDWWALWYRARGFSEAPPPGRFRTTLSSEYLDIALAVAGQGIAIGSPILFRNEIDAGRLVPAHDFVAGDGRAFWFTYPAAREQARKIAAFRDWVGEEAARDRDAARTYLGKVVIVKPTPYY